MRHPPRKAVVGLSSLRRQAILLHDPCVARTDISGPRYSSGRMMKRPPLVEGAFSLAAYQTAVKRGAWADSTKARISFRPLPPPGDEGRRSGAGSGRQASLRRSPRSIGPQMWERLTWHDHPGTVTVALRWERAERDEVSVVRFGNPGSGSVVTHYRGPGSAHHHAIAASVFGRNADQITACSRRPIAALDVPNRRHISKKHSWPWNLSRHCV
jgi:hypothetical protein